MGSFSVALTAWAFTVGGAPADEPTDAFVVQAPTDLGGVPLEMPPDLVGGFRLEGSPELDLVFGDTDRFRTHIDRFYALAERMSANRRIFSYRVKAALKRLTPDRTSCSGALAKDVKRAVVAANDFRRDGASFEEEFRTIGHLARFGETAGLTPDYRWRVHHVRDLYDSAVKDLREMQLAAHDQLGAELRARKCRLDRLQPTKEPPTIAAIPTKKRRRVPAQTATFVIDSKSCGKSRSVVLDNEFLGQVPAGATMAFQTETGHHAICVGDSAEQCRDQRAVYIHDGWSVTVHCES